jgi:hypothetical protein
MKNGTAESLREALREKIAGLTDSDLLETIRVTNDAPTKEPGFTVNIMALSEYEVRNGETATDALMDELGR